MRAAGGGSAYDDGIVRARLRQAFGRLIRSAGDKGHFVLLGAATPSRLLDAFPEGVPTLRVTLDEAVARIAGSKLMMSAEEVALITVRALEKNRAIIIPGWRNRLLALSPRLAPRWLVRKISGRLNRPFTGA